MESLSDSLKYFNPVSLDEMDNVKLMNRIDTKFVFRVERLPEFLRTIAHNYMILQVNDIRQCSYENLYFDTLKLQLYLQHHNGKLNRYKVRYRRYVDSDTCFFELKFKNNKDRTIKDRVRRDQIEDKIEGNAEKLLQKKSFLQASELFPVVWIYYKRITLVSECSRERCTLDMDLSLKNDKADCSFPNLVIAEVKQDKCCSSAFLNLMKESYIRSSTMSKYCFGIANVNQEIKKNIFKPKLNAIKKICYDQS